MDYAHLIARVSDERASKAIELHCGGLAPCDIDRRLGMPAGTARAIVSAAWADEKNGRDEMRRAMRAAFEEVEDA